MSKDKSKEKLMLYDSNKRYTFLNATIWECIKFWLITKLTGTDLDK